LEVLALNKVTNEQEFHAIIAKPQTTVAVFKTTWCKDCQYIEPFMPDIEKAYEGRIEFIELDRDEVPDLCEQLNILGIPSFIAFREGQELVRFVSKLRKTREEIEQFLDRAVEVSQALANKA
jgi:thioredoxin-like negative regulator of GroEL